MFKGSAVIELRFFLKEMSGLIQEAFSQRFLEYIPSDRNLVT